MPLLKRKSQQAFEHNVKAEINSGKPQKQALAIYDEQRRAKRKKMADGGDTNKAQKPAYGTSDETSANQASNAVNLVTHPIDFIKSAWAEGGSVKKPQPKKMPKMAESKLIKAKPMYAHGGMMEDEESAASESRPMPDKKYNDSKDVAQNSGKKPLKDSDWTGRPTVRQAQEASPSSEKRPKIQGENDFNGNELISADKPDGYGKQPRSSYNEEGPDQQGPAVPDMAREHNNGRKPYAKGGEIDLERPDAQASRHNKSVDDEYGDGAEKDNESSAQPGGPKDDMERGPGMREYMDNMHMAPLLARGGSVSDEPDQNEQMEERHDSIAAAVMARRDRLHAAIDSGAADLDEAARMASGGSVESGSRDMNYADGGEVMLKENYMEQPNRYYKANEHEALDWPAADVPMPDQPEDSNEKGHNLPDEDSHDMVESIRRKMKAKRQF